MACDSSEPGIDIDRPPQNGDGWETAFPQQVGIDSAPLADMLDLIASTENHLIHSLLIVKDRKLVLEEYWPGVDLDPETLGPVERRFDRNTLHYVASVSKSITSALLGIAVDQRLVASVDDSVSSYFPEYPQIETSDKVGITLRHLLSFSSGLEWNEFVYDFGDPRDSHNQMFGTIDPVGFLLGRPLTFASGSRFHYNSGDTNILGEIIRMTSGSNNLLEFANEYFFDPLGIEDYTWRRFPMAPEVTFASGGASLRPRDMAKLGAVYLNGGVWNGERIVPERWVDESTRMAVPLSGTYRTLYGYGYNWWLGRFPVGNSRVDYFRAAGWGGQDVYVIPELEMVIVFTAGAYHEAGALSVEELIEDYILRAAGE